MKFGLFLMMLAFTSKNEENKAERKSEERLQDKNSENLIFVKIEEDECTKVQKKSSKYIGVTYKKSKARWSTVRRSKHEKKLVSNGIYNDEETAAHASDTLARKLMANGEQNHKLNFPDDHTEVNSRTKMSSKYIGVTYNERDERWVARRWSKCENKTVCNGNYKNEETAAYASDTLARKLMANGEQNHKLNFPDVNTEVNPKKKKTLI